LLYWTFIKVVTGETLGTPTYSDNITIGIKDIDIVKVKVKQSQEVESPRFLDNGHMKVVRLFSLTYWPPLPPRKYSWYSFLLEAEST
jgi:hypothetical protein